MKTNMTYSTKEQAERMGTAEAEKLTRRGYPTTLIEVRPVAIVTESRFYTMGDQESDWSSVPHPATRWEAVLS